MEIIIMVFLLLVLLAFSSDAYHVAKAKETADAKETARWRTMDLALTDERGVCWVCQQYSGVLELVDVGRRYELACCPCATAIKALKAPTSEAA